MVAQAPIVTPSCTVVNVVCPSTSDGRSSDRSFTQARG